MTYGTSECRECLAERAHCHGTLIHHWGQQAQCTDAECNYPEVALHSLSVDCDAVACDCGELTRRRLAG